jgi:hypothetical protein
VSGGKDEFEHDALIASRSATLADIAEQLLDEDAGAALIGAALISWERKYGRAEALVLAGTALLGIHEQVQPRAASRPN